MYLLYCLPTKIHALEHGVKTIAEIILMDNDFIETPVLDVSSDVGQNDKDNEDSNHLDNRLIDVNYIDVMPALVSALSPPNPQVEITTDNKCSFCIPSKCCTYITQEIEVPRTIRQFDTLLWQLAHDNIQLYKEEGDWYLLINSVCSNLLPDGGCGIYDTRPMVCREHTNDHCEYDSSAEESFDLFFPTYEALDIYCRKRFKGWDKRFDNPNL